ncbi:hypothetical protein HAX54_007642 [Datura stramonium]|uniref:Uncharacterized protein n=1 Tax=Datura stramonium TaxID=4076 RepID=A0ABS8TDJ0_DATST|nr:hypothetical protein [Datura stramonium]
MEKMLREMKKNILLWYPKLQNHVNLFDGSASTRKEKRKCVFDNETSNCSFRGKHAINNQKSMDQALHLSTNNFPSLVEAHEEIMAGHGQHDWMNMEIKRSFENYHMAQNANGGSVVENFEGFWGGNVLEQLHYENMNLNDTPSKLRLRLHIHREYRTNWSMIRKS